MINVFSTYKNDLKGFLFYLSIFFIAFDSFPKFIGGSMYRPISIFPILFYFLILCYECFSLKRKFRKNDLLLLFVFSVYLSISFIKGFFYNDFSGVTDFFFTGILGLITLFVYNDYFIILRKKCSKSVFFNKVAKIYIEAMIIPGILGFIQIFNIITKKGTNIIYRLYSFFTIRFEPSRVFLVCGEPSWAVIYLIVLFYFVVFSMENNKKKLYILITSVLILFTFSTLGYLSIIIAFFIYFIFIIIKNPKYLKKLFLLIFVCFILFIVANNLFASSNSYVANRYKQIIQLLKLVLEPEKLHVFIQVTDNSLFVRFINPIIALKMCLLYPFLGVGGGYYYKLYPKIIKKDYPLSVNLVEVKNTLKNGYQITSKNLYCRFFAEFGIIPGLVFFIKSIRNLTSILKEDKKSLWLLSLLFMTVFNYDSLCYVLFIFLYTFLINYNSYIDEEKV